jgi:hypothetical protein
MRQAQVNLSPSNRKFVEVFRDRKVAERQWFEKFGTFA